MTGWIKIHRQIRQWKWYKDSATVHLFLHLLISAKYEEEDWQGIRIHRGQLVTSRAALSKETGLSDTEVRTALNHLKITSNITSSFARKQTIITICNYERYQLGDISDLPDDLPDDLPENYQIEPQIPILNKEEKNIYNIISKDINIKSKTPEVIPYDDIKNLWNSMVSKCPRLIKLNDARKRQVKLRVGEMGGISKAKETLITCFKKINESSFLTGEKGDWRADFDWFFKNGKNWLKVLEGNYDNNNRGRDGYNRLQSDIEEINNLFNGTINSDIPEEQ